MENPTHRKILIPSIVIVAVAVFLVIFNAPISKALTSLNFTPKAETYTELYFNNPETLPKHIVNGQAAHFSFTIHNVEGVQTIYPYTVAFVYSTGRTVTISKGTLTLPNNASQTVNITHTFADSSEKGMVQVTLVNLHQSIDFLIPNNN